MIYFVDKNKALCNAIEALKCDSVEVVWGDVFDVKGAHPCARIVTASNPNFSAGGGLDSALAKEFPVDWALAKEFALTNNLLFVVSVGFDYRATCEGVIRALAGVRGQHHAYDLILTGLGTGIGGLAVTTFVDLFKKVLVERNLSFANLCEADLSCMYFRDVNFRGANLNFANLSFAVFNGAVLRGVSLNNAQLNATNFIGADLTDANFSDCSCVGCNFSRAKGLVYDRDFLKQFVHTDKGVIVYKAFGDTYYGPNPDWVIEPNSILTENVDWSLTEACGCGINFASLDWVRANFRDEDVTIWECLIEYDDLPFVVVPFGSGGKARCQRLTLLRSVVERVV